MVLGVIVEGHGDVAAVPVLVRRLVPHLEVRRPFRLPRGCIVKEQELKRAVELVARSLPDGSAILTLFDADEDCPASLGPRILEWATQARPDRLHSVILARQEFEAWFLGGVGGIAGRRGVPAAPVIPVGPIEDVASPKAWFDRSMPHGYSETIDQPAFAATFDLGRARAACPSFDKLCRDLEELAPQP